MDFHFSDIQAQLRESIAKYLARSYDFDTRQRVVHSAEGWRREVWSTFAELGLLAAPFAEEDGGLGGGPVDIMVTMEEIGKALVVEPFFPSVVLCGGLLARHGDTAQKEAHLAPLMAGERIFAFAGLEAKSRFDLCRVETRLARQNGGWRLDGAKAVVHGAPFADYLIVSARDSGDIADRTGLSLVLVPKSAPGVTTRDYRTVDGGRASEIRFDGVHLAAGDVLGEPGAAAAKLDLLESHAIAALSAEAVGGMKMLYEQTLDYAKTRKQFGVAIASFQVIQHRLVDMFMAYEQALSACYLATLKLDASDAERQRAASAAKVQIGQQGRFVGQNAVQIHGGIGMTNELKLGHYFKRVTMIDSLFGNVDHHLAHFARLDRGAR